MAYNTIERRDMKTQKENLLEAIDKTREMVEKQEFFGTHCNYQIPIDENDKHVRRILINVRFG